MSTEDSGRSTEDRGPRSSSEAARRQAAHWSLLIFDLDGTLVDTRDGIVATFRETLATAGFPPPPPEVVTPLIGLTLDTMFRRFVPDAASDGLVPRLIDAYRSLYHEAVTPYTRAFPEVIETLRSFRRNGLKLAVATSKLTRIAQETLQAAGLAGTFAIVLGSDSVGRPKPAPDLVLRILTELDARAEEALVVGDTTHDVGMGRAAGTRTCAVTYGAQSRAELLAAEPDFVLDRFGELSDVVSGAPR